MKTDLGRARPGGARPSAPRNWPKTARSTRSTGSADDNVYLFSGNEDQTVTRPVVRGGRALLQGGRRRRPATSPWSRAKAATPSSPSRAAPPAASRPRLMSATATTTRPRPSSAGSTARSPPPSAEPQGRFIVFDQSAFREPGDGFADEGVVYVPQGCAEQPGCRVHIALHGCEQSREAVGDTFVKESGFAEIADTNRLIVLFPQVEGEHDQPARLLGLVGLYRPRLSRQGRAADQSDLGHGRAACRDAMNAPEMEDDLSVVEAPFGSELYRQALALARGDPARAARAYAHRGGACRRSTPPAFLREVLRRGGGVGLAQAARGETIQLRQMAVAEERRREKHRGAAARRSPKTGRAAKATGSWCSMRGSAPRGSTRAYGYLAARRAVRREHRAAYQNDQSLLA